MSHFNYYVTRIFRSAKFPDCQVMKIIMHFAVLSGSIWKPRPPSTEKPGAASARNQLRPNFMFSPSPNHRAGHEDEL